MQCLGCQKRIWFFQDKVNFSRDMIKQFNASDSESIDALLLHRNCLYNEEDAAKARFKTFRDGAVRRNRKANKGIEKDKIDFETGELKR